MSDTPSLIVGAPDTPGSIDIPLESSSSSSTTRRLVISVVGKKFVPNGHSISKTITENFKERQDATGYTWRSVTESILFDHVAEERIKILEKKVSYMRENQERVLQERVELEVQQRVEQEVFRLRQQSDDLFKSMEEQWSRMMSDMTLFSRSFSNPTLPNRDSSNA
ncbi:hypothetical protein BC332_13762 [Capsicum chinense]|nr:hypothetical protein BC332_13762 [Capsicum chinense]